MKLFALMGMLMMLTALAEAQNATCPSNAPGQRCVALTWSESSTGVTSFNIYRSSTSGGEGATPYATVPGTQPSFADITVVSGQTYYYQVTAVLSVESPPSSEVKAIVPQTPAVPTGLAATAK